MAQKRGQWKSAWEQPVFRRRVFIVFALLSPILASLSTFFQYIERRNGKQLNDVVLNHIQSVDVSLYIFILVWSMALLITVRAIQQPEIFITFLFSFFILTISRLSMIGLIPLNAPNHLIPLVDPLTNMFYGKVFITKDLFYSGHVSTQFLIFLCLKRKQDKWLAALSTISMAALVLVQHVHYTIDIVAAPFFSYACFMAGRHSAKNGIRF